MEKRMTEEDMKGYLQLVKDYKIVIDLLKLRVMREAGGTYGNKIDYWNEYKIAHNITEY